MKGPFYCYVLASRAGRTYVGATNNPARRLRQHRGELKGGARATRAGRDWRMVFLVGGFPGWGDALAFERGLKNVCRAYRLRGLLGRRAGLARLLAHPRWARAPLTLREATT